MTQKIRGLISRIFKEKKWELFLRSWDSNLKIYLKRTGCSTVKSSHVKENYLQVGKKWKDKSNNQKFTLGCVSQGIWQFHSLLYSQGLEQCLENNRLSTNICGRNCLMYKIRTHLLDRYTNVIDLRIALKTEVRKKRCYKNTKETAEMSKSIF